MKPELIVAILALLVSVGVFVVHYKNQIERRHGEIVQLRSQILAALSAQHQRFTSLLLHGELLRLELRRTPDSESKYPVIEKLPSVLQTVAQLKNASEKFTRQFQDLKTEAENTSATLVRLQKAAATFDALTPKTQGVEDDMLALLTDVREQTKA